jgi:spectinomycin phosphotransferase
MLHFKKDRKNETKRAMRTQPRILEEHLRTCLREQYDLYPATLDFLPRGLDYNAGVYRVVGKQGTAFLLKVTSRPLYEPAFLVPFYLNNQGITSVVAPMPTKSAALWVRLEDWTVVVYPFLDGDTSWNGMTDEQWKTLGNTFKRIHAVQLPPEGFELLRKESFDPTEYIRWIHSFEAQHLSTQQAESVSEHALRASWMAQRSTIHMIVDALEKLAAVLQKRTFPYVICHADLHPANLLRDQAGHVFVIDWDEVMLAPKERDFIYVREPQVEAFLQGYEQTGIDWTALTYYLWERVVQDLIACAGLVCLEKDWAEETKADNAQMFHEILTGEGSDLAAASAAAAHLPDELTSHNNPGA